ncbi:MAG TPA: nucleotidyltransferase domain-containing protein [Thermoanaerobaculia bacterium]|nr:nucleotidyltransferase domain-containing protein [Thermoanaerobaculia bacterium]
MQNRFSSSHVETWPSRGEVVAALRSAAERLRERHPEITRIGYFGSLDDGSRYGFGSDADVVIVVAESARPFAERGRAYDLGAMPVPVDLFVYTEKELEQFLGREDQFGRGLQNTVWLEPVQRMPA